jgi:uroporphyrinogen III methyltransferase/synthase
MRVLARSTESEIVNRGIVHLVGAGPGDPGCLTLRGRECLSVAEVVVYDYLANPELLAFAPASAERIFAGKHGAGPHLLEQAEINALLVERARAGRRVVRLKGGDPFVFGRGGEEAEALAAAGVRFEIVPGVSAAYSVPAFAGIPVTHRDWVSGVTVLTGHEAHDKRAHQVRWDLVATAGNTIVLLMGLRQMSRNLERLLRAGLVPTTPAAAIRWGGTPRQRVMVATAGTLADEVARGGIQPPVTVVIGEVVRLREALAWFEQRPLFGRRVMVTRARAQASVLARLLGEAGADVVECAAIEIADPDSTAPLDGALDRLGEYDWVVFTSVNGVDRFFARLAARGGDVRRLHRARIAAIGPETARSLEARLVRTDCVPAEFRAEGLLEALSGEALEGKRILLPRAMGARQVLPEELRARGAIVDEVVSYRSIVPEASREALRRALADGDTIDCLTFTSSSTVTHFLALVDEVDAAGGRARLASARVACIGPITAKTAQDAGLRVDVVPAEYTIPSLARAVVASFAREES